MSRFSKRLLGTLYTVSVIVLFTGMGTVAHPDVVRIEKDKMFIDDHEISKTWKVDSLQAAIGRPDTMTGNGHPNAMFDNFDLGIRYWQDAAKEIGPYAEDIKFYITKHQDDDQENEHEAFSGLIVLDGVALDSTVSRDQLRKKLVGGWRECTAFEGAIEFMSRDIFVFAGFDHSYSELQWVAVGKITSIISSCN